MSRQLLGVSEPMRHPSTRDTFSGAINSCKHVKSFGRARQRLTMHPVSLIEDCLMPVPLPEMHGNHTKGIGGTRRTVTDARSCGLTLPPR